MSLPPDAPPPAEGGPPARRPYEKPAVAWEETLESRPNLMAGCGKIAGQDATCDDSPAS